MPVQLSRGSTALYHILVRDADFTSRWTELRPDHHVPRSMKDLTDPFAVFCFFSSGASAVVLFRGTGVLAFWFRRIYRRRRHGFVSASSCTS